MYPESESLFLLCPALPCCISMSLTFFHTRNTQCLINDIMIMAENEMHKSQYFLTQPLCAMFALASYAQVNTNCFFCFDAISLSTESQTKHALVEIFFPSIFLSFVWLRMFGWILISQGSKVSGNCWVCFQVQQCLSLCSTFTLFKGC